MSEGIFFRTYSKLDDKFLEKALVFRDRCKRSEPRRRDGNQATRKDKYCSDKDIFKWILAQDGDDIVGMIAVYKRKVMYQQEELVLGGIGEMRVSEDYQRRGIGSKLTKIALDKLDNGRADVALLCTNFHSFLLSFYRKFGFEILGKPYKYKGMSGKDYIETEGMLAPINSHDLYVKIMKSSEILDIGIGNW